MLSNIIISKKGRMLPIFLLVVIISTVDSIYQSKIKFTPSGFEYQPNYNIQLLSTNTIQTKMLCSAQCNQLPSCRVFDYDTLSKRCRLFEGDSTIGSTISSTSSTSVVGTVQISSSLYSSIYNQPCEACPQNRYDLCSINTNTCQCPDHSYWNGTVCALQLFPNQTCGHWNSCRADLGVTCLTDCYGNDIPRCLSSILFNATYLYTMPFGITVAGACNGSNSTNQTILSNQAKPVVGYNNTIYVGDNTNRLFAFDPNNRTGRVLKTFGNWPAFLFLDNRTGNIYATIFLINLVSIWPTNATIPANGIPYNNCSMYWVVGPTGIILDSAGNVYVSSYYCHWVMKWAPNATSATLVAGSPTGTPGNDSLSLFAPYALILDEANSLLYVVDRYNYRIQRFVVGGSGVGVTVAGGNGAGTAPNQLNRPTDMYISKIDGSLYICDCFNSRIQKWQMNATYGVTVVGSANAIIGPSPYLLNRPYGFAFDDQETYLYVSDSQNNRIQRFSLH